MGHTFLCLLCFYLVYSLPKDGQAKARRYTATLRAEKTVIPAGGSVALTCSVNTYDTSGWAYQFFERQRNSSEVRVLSNCLSRPSMTVQVTEGSNYGCRASKGDSSVNSTFVPIYMRMSNRAALSLEPNWPNLFKGEVRTLRCDIQGGEDSEWEYDWKTTTQEISSGSKEYQIKYSADGNSEEYRCKGRKRGDPYSSTEWSKAIRLEFHSAAEVEISFDKKGIPAGGSANLTCSVKPQSSGWNYSWSIGESVRRPIAPQDAVIVSQNQIRALKGGSFWCTAKRGNPVYPTSRTGYIQLGNLVKIKPVLKIQPKWPKIYKGEQITLTCEIKDGEQTDWEYDWGTTATEPHSFLKYNKQREIVQPASNFKTGEYWCAGRNKRIPTTMTENSTSSKLIVYKSVSKPTLIVSPSWLSPGDSVTLTCKVDDPTAGWRFYWYKVVPNLSKNKYLYEPLPGSSSGTAEDFYIDPGQKHTAGYSCKAERGDPVFSTEKSDPQFVWSGDSESAFLSVSSNRVQHFAFGSITLNCAGDSVEWRVRDDNSFCQMTGDTCTISNAPGRKVYWCESGSGEFSNAVNISTHSTDVILVSPVLPVTEGDSLNLGCLSKTGNLHCETAFFYRNDKTIGRAADGMFQISAVSKSDEGLYSCKCGHTLSPDSWVAVKFRRSPFVNTLKWVLFGVVCSALIVLLGYKQSTGPIFYRLVPCLNQNQESSADHSQETQPHYNSLHHGDLSPYESIDQQYTGTVNSEYEYVNVTRPSIQTRSPHESRP